MAPASQPGDMDSASDAPGVLSGRRPITAPPGLNRPPTRRPAETTAAGGSGNSHHAEGYASDRASSGACTWCRWPCSVLRRFGTALQTNLRQPAAGVAGQQPEPCLRLLHRS